MSLMSKDMDKIIRLRDKDNFKLPARPTKPRKPESCSGCEVRRPRSR